MMTPKQAAFVREYLIDRNGTQAAIRAGYAKNSADVTACKLLINPKVKAAVAKGTEEHAERCAVTLESLTDELNEAAGMARGQDDSNALRQAVMAKAKLHGYDIVKNEHAGPNGGPVKTEKSVFFIPVGADGSD